MSVKSDVERVDRPANRSMSVKSDVERVGRPANGSMSVKSDVEIVGRPANGSMSVKSDVEIVDRAANRSMRQFCSFFHPSGKSFVTFLRLFRGIIPERGLIPSYSIGTNLSM
ncbi:hypothetical protein FHR92_002491 [Fontibacillus solani]|uniref:Uncharacterized protein n=1 Tax=Fontibacillus solani TaxID=1572857 RepID=A0A7W3STU2_9BACL|nr:hypothetical protein [Fontibacillus solani]MBA9086019.1 hypothetical protein [Fontibacillus solani]